MTLINADDRELECQWIDITDADTTALYDLRVVINPAERIIEDDYSNNRMRIPLDLSQIPVVSMGPIDYPAPDPGECYAFIDSFHR